MAELLRCGSDQKGRALSGCEQAGEDANPGIAFDVLEEHRGSGLGGPQDGSSSADVTVYAGEFGVGVDRSFGAEELPWSVQEEPQCRAKIMDLFRVGGVLGNPERHASF